MKLSLLSTLLISLLITGCGIERNNEEFIELDLDFAEKTSKPIEEKQPKPEVSDEEGQPVGSSTDRPPSQDENESQTPPDSNSGPTPEIVADTDDAPEESNNENPEINEDANQTPPESVPLPTPEPVVDTDEAPEESSEEDEEETHSIDGNIDHAPEESEPTPTPEPVVDTDEAPEESNNENPEINEDANQTPPESVPLPTPEPVVDTDEAPEESSEEDEEETHSIDGNIDHAPEESEPTPTPEPVVDTDEAPEESSEEDVEEIPSIDGNIDHVQEESEPTPTPEPVVDTDEAPEESSEEDEEETPSIDGNIAPIPDEGPAIEDGTEPIPSPSYSATELAINPNYTNPRCNDILEINGDTLCAGSVTDSPFGVSVILNLTKLNSNWEYRIDHGAFKKLIKISDELILAYREQMDFHRPNKSIGSLYLINPTTGELISQFETMESGEVCLDLKVHNQKIYCAGTTSELLDRPQVKVFDLSLNHIVNSNIQEFNFSSSNISNMRCEQILKIYDGSVTCLGTFTTNTGERDLARMTFVTPIQTVDSENSFTRAYGSFQISSVVSDLIQTTPELQEWCGEGLHSSCLDYLHDTVIKSPLSLSSHGELRITLTRPSLSLYNEFKNVVIFIQRETRLSSTYFISSYKPMIIGEDNEYLEIQESNEQNLLVTKSVLTTPSFIKIERIEEHTGVLTTINSESYLTEELDTRFPVNVIMGEDFIRVFGNQTTGQFSPPLRLISAPVE